MPGIDQPNEQPSQKELLEMELKDRRSLLKEIEEKLREDPSLVDKRTFLETSTKVGALTGKIKAIENGFKDENSLKVFGLIGALWERCNAFNTMEGKNYSGLHNAIRSLHFKANKTFNYDNSSESIQELAKELNDKIISKISKVGIDGKRHYANNDVRDMFGATNLIKEVNEIDFDKIQQERNEDIELDVPKLLKKAARDAAEAQAELDKNRAKEEEAEEALQKYVFLLHEMQKKGYTTLIENHFKEMLAEQTEEKKQQNMNLMARVAKEFTDIDVTMYDNMVFAEQKSLQEDLRAEANSETDIAVFGKLRPVVRQSNLNLSGDIRMFAKSRVAGNIIVENEIGRADEQNKAPDSFKTLKNDRSLLNSMLRSIGNGNLNAEMDNLRQNVASSWNEVNQRIERVSRRKEMLGGNDPTIDVKKSDERGIEYIKAESDHSNRSNLKQTHSLTDFFAVKHEMISGAKNFISQIKQTTKTAEKFSSHTPEYEQLYNALQKVRDLEDNSSAYEVYEAVQDLKSGAESYNNAKKNKSLSGNNKKRADISVQIEEFCKDKLMSLDSAINKQNPVFFMEKLKADKKRQKKNQNADNANEARAQRDQEEEERIARAKAEADNYSDGVKRRIHSAADSFIRRMERIKQKTISSKDRELYDWYTSLKTLWQKTSSDNRKNLSDEQMTAALLEAKRKGEAYLKKNASIFNFGEKKQLVDLARKFQTSCDVTLNSISILNGLKSLIQKPEKPQGQEENPQEIAREPDGWVSKIARDAGKYQGDWNLIRRRASELFDQLDATLPQGEDQNTTDLTNKRFKGRSDSFKRMYNALKTVKNDTPYDFQELQSSIAELKNAADEYYNQHNKTIWTTEGQIRQDVSRDIRLLDLENFNTRTEQLLKSGLFTKTDSPEDMLDGIREMEQVNRENISDQLIKTCQKKLYSNDDNQPGAVTRMLDAMGITGNDTNPEKLIANLKQCFDLQTRIEIEKAKKEEKPIHELQQEFPEEAFRYLQEIGLDNTFIDTHSEMSAVENKGDKLIAYRKEKKELDELNRRWKDAIEKTSKEHSVLYWQKKINAIGGYLNFDNSGHVTTKEDEIDIKKKIKDWRVRTNKTQDIVGGQLVDKDPNKISDREIGVILGSEVDRIIEKLKIDEKRYNDLKAENKRKTAELDKNAANYKERKEFLENEYNRINHIHNENIRRAKAINELIPQSYRDFYNLASEYAKKEKEFKEKERPQFTQAEVKSPNIQGLTEKLRALSAKYKEDKMAYDSAVKELESNKGNPSVFKNELRQVISQRLEMRKDMQKQAMTVRTFNEMKYGEADDKQYENAKKTLEENYEAVFQYKSPEEIVSIMKDTKKASEFVSEIAGFEKKYELDQVNWGETNAVIFKNVEEENGVKKVIPKLNTRGINALRKELKHMIYNNKAALHKLSEKYQLAQTEESKKEIITDAGKHINNIIKVSAAIVALGSIEQRGKYFPQAFTVQNPENPQDSKSLTLNELMNVKTGEKNIDGKEIQGGFIDKIYNSEAFMRFVRKCDAQAQHGDNKNVPFSSVDHLVDNVLNNKTEKLIEIVKNSYETPGVQFDPRATSGFDLEGDPKSGTLDVRFVFDPIGKIRIPANVEKNDYLDSLKRERERLEVKEREIHGDILCDFVEDLRNPHFKEMDKEDAELFLDKFCSLIKVKGMIYDNESKRKQAEHIGDKPFTINSYNRQYDENPEAMRNALRNIFQNRTLKILMKNLEEGKIIEQLNIMMHKPLEQNKQRSADDRSLFPDPKPLNQMKQNERNALVNKTKCNLETRCAELADLYEAKKKELAMMEKEEITGPRMEKARREYAQIVNEAVRNIAVLTFISTRRNMMKQGSADPLAESYSTWDREVVGGARTVTEEEAAARAQKNEKVEPGTVSVNIGIENKVMKQYDFRLMLSSYENDFGKLLRCAAKERLPLDDKTLPSLQNIYKEAQTEAQTLPSLREIRKDAKTKFLNNIIDPDLHKGIRPSDTVRDVNREFEIAGVKIRPMNQDDVENFVQEKQKDKVQAVLDSNDKKLDNLKARLQDVRNQQEFVSNLKTNAASQQQDADSIAQYTQALNGCKELIAEYEKKAYKECTKLLDELKADDKSRKLVESVKNSLESKYGANLKSAEESLKRKINTIALSTEFMKPETHLNEMKRPIAELLVCEGIMKEKGINADFIKNMTDPIRFKQEVEKCQKMDKFKELVKMEPEKLTKWIQDTSKQLTAIEMYKPLQEVKEVKAQEEKGFFNGLKNLFGIKK